MPHCRSGGTCRFLPGEKDVCAMTLETVRNRIRFYRDFPKEGILFIDLLPLLGDSDIFAWVVREIAARISSPNVAVPEARGFLFASPLLTVPGGVKSLLIFRKSGKLPARADDLVKIPIEKEYGDDSLYFRKSDLKAARTEDGSVEVTVFDDVLATGGTAEGMALELNRLTVETAAGLLPVRVREFVFLAEIADIGARSRLERIAPVESMLRF